MKEKGNYILMSRATDTEGHQQPMNAKWNVLGLGNNGVREHAVTVQITWQLTRQMKSPGNVVTLGKKAIEGFCSFRSFFNMLLCESSIIFR